MLAMPALTPGPPSRPFLWVKTDRISLLKGSWDAVALLLLHVKATVCNYLNYRALVGISGFGKSVCRYIDFQWSIT